MKDYPYIRAWEKFLGSYDWYANVQVEKAREDHAPKDAIYREPGFGVYKDRGGMWHTFEEITDPLVKKTVGTLALEFMVEP